jgi:mono/diheme cytochrome c family protein
MKTTLLNLIAFALLLLVACKAKKQNASTPAASTPVTSSSPNSSVSGVGLLMAKPSDGIYAPGEEELTVIQPYYKDITLDKLNKGYSLYAQSACIQCHSAKNIYTIETSQWKDILNDMSEKAKISDEQKDAVNKYVLAIKATKAKRAQ